MDATPIPAGAAAPDSAALVAADRWRLWRRANGSRTPPPR